MLWLGFFYPLHLTNFSKRNLWTICARFDLVFIFHSPHIFSPQSTSTFISTHSEYSPSLPFFTNPFCRRVIGEALNNTPGQTLCPRFPCNIYHVPSVGGYVTLMSYQDSVEVVTPNGVELREYHFFHDYCSTKGILKLQKGAFIYYTFIPLCYVWRRQYCYSESSAVFLLIYGSLMMDVSV